MTETEFTMRTLTVIDALKDRRIIPSDRQFALKIGIDPTQISNARRGEREIPNKYIDKIVNTFGVNRIYLDAGVGEMFAQDGKGNLHVINPDETNQKRNTSVTPFESDTTVIGEMPGPGEDNTLIEVGAGRFVMVVPLVPIKAYAGYIDNYNNQEFFEGLSVHTLSVTNNYKGRYMAFVVKGESMSNGTDESINEGDIVTGREIQRHHWRNKLHLHRFEDYVIVHKDGIVTKRIIAHDVEQGIITCRSLNPDKNRFPDYPIFLDDCIQIFNIVAVTKTK